VYGGAISEVQLKAAALLGQVELTVSYSSKERIPFVEPEHENWSLTIFRVPNPHYALKRSDFDAPDITTSSALVPDGI
jgi:hypothetical protein